MIEKKDLGAFLLDQLIVGVAHGVVVFNKDHYSLPLVHLHYEINFSYQNKKKKKEHQCLNIDMRYPFNNSIPCQCKHEERWLSAYGDFRYTNLSHKWMP